MHLHFPFSAAQVLWTITFAAQLVLLVVLLGRDRAARFPFFTASIVLFALRLLAEVLLNGRLPIPTLQILFITLADLAALVGVALVFEIARRAFAGIRRRLWQFGAIALLAVASLVIAFWGPWPGKSVLVLDSPMAVLKLMQFFAQKADMFADVLMIQLGILIVLFGRHFHAGWRSHVQRIVIGLSTVAISWLAIEGLWQIIAKTVHPHSREEYERILDLGTKLVNANKVVYIVALVWWIACLWPDEPGEASSAGQQGPLHLPEDEAAEEHLLNGDNSQASTSAHPAL